MRERVKQFIENNINLIEDSKWDEVQHQARIKLRSNEIGEFNYSLIKAGINPTDGLNYIPYSFLCYSPIEHYDIEESIEEIHIGSFEGCDKLETISIPDTVTYIDGDVFNGCKSLRSLKLPNSLKTDFTALNLYNDMGTIELTLPDHITLEKFLAPITSMAEAKRFKAKGDYTIIIQKTPYHIKDLYNKLMEKFIKQKELRTATIPDLYRVKTHGYTLQTTTFDKKQNKMRVRWIHDGAGQAYNCPLFFLSEKEAQDFVDRTVASHILTTPGYLEIYKARLSMNDINFTKIDTLYGPALIQSWKDGQVDPACIIKKNVF